MPSVASLALVSPSQIVADWAGNLERILRGLDEARRRGARLVVLPELAISGYALGDRVHRADTFDRSWASLRALAAAAPDLWVAVGLPVQIDGVPYTAVAVASGGAVRGLVLKHHLAHGGPEYENRWFASWPEGHARVVDTPDGPVPAGEILFVVDGVGTIGVEICEDAWRGDHPGGRLALAGAELVLNASASWFVLGKHTFRQRMVQRISESDAVAYAFVSLAGCESPPFVFDGAALVATGGALVADGPRFRFDTDVGVTDVRLDLAAVGRRRRTTGSWRDQAARATAHGGPHVVRVPGSFAASGPPSLPVEGAREDRMSDLEDALVLGLRDYLRRTGLTRVVVALSGGRDSSMVALLVRRVAARDPTLAVHLITVWMETEHSSNETRAAASAFAADIGADHRGVSITPLLESHHEVMEALLGERLSWTEPRHDLPLQNLQARTRGVVAWTVANVERALLLTTSNLSEAAVGYCTMDGDTAGGLAPIGGVPKTLVSEWLAWARDRHGVRSLDAVLASPPTAELRPLASHQTDEGDLMPYAVLDDLIVGTVVEGWTEEELRARTWPVHRARYADRDAFDRDVSRFLRLITAAQWKREKLAQSFRIVGFDLEPKSGLRWPSVQAPLGS